MTTLGDLVGQTLNEILLGTYRAHYNKLKANIDDSASDMTLSYSIQGIGEGSYLECGDELMYINPGGVNTSSSLLTVARGALGTTPIAHGLGAMVEANPRFPRSFILNTMRDEVLSWPFTLFRTSTAQVTASTGEMTLALTGTDIIKVMRVFRPGMGIASDRKVPVSGWRTEYDLDGAGACSVFLSEGFGGGTTYTLQIGRKFVTDEWLMGTDLDDIGVAASMAEILKYGAAWRLLMGRESRRLFVEAEVESRKAGDVPVQANTMLGRSMKAIRDQRIQEESDRLRRIYGTRG